MESEYHIIFVEEERVLSYHDKPKKVGRCCARLVKIENQKLGDIVEGVPQVPVYIDNINDPYVLERKNYCPTFSERLLICFGDYFYQVIRHINNRCSFIRHEGNMAWHCGVDEPTQRPCLIQ